MIAAHKPIAKCLAKKSMCCVECIHGPDGLFIHILGLLFWFCLFYNPAIGEPLFLTRGKACYSDVLLKCVVKSCLYPEMRPKISTPGLQNVKRKR